MTRRAWGGMELRLPEIWPEIKPIRAQYLLEALPDVVDNRSSAALAPFDSAPITAPTRMWILAGTGALLAASLATSLSGRTPITSADAIGCLPVWSCSTGVMRGSSHVTAAR